MRTGSGNGICRGMRRGLVLLLALAALLPRTALAHGELLVRIAELSRRIEAATNDLGRLHLERGELYRQDQNWSAAEADYNRAAELDATLPVELCRARLLADAGQLEAARARFDAWLARRPEDAPARLDRAGVLLRLGRLDEAVADFRQALQFPGCPRPEQVLETARALSGAKRTDEALSVLDQGLQRLGPLPALQFEALTLELNRKHYEAALRRLDSILVRAHRKEEWLARRGEILAAAGRPAEARTAFHAALEAIRKLPARIQQNPPMLKLKSEIQAALARLDDAALVARTNP